MVGALAAHVGRGQAVQFGVNQRKQLFGGFAVASPQGFQQSGDVIVGNLHMTTAWEWDVPGRLALCTVIVCGSVDRKRSRVCRLGATELRA